MGARDIERMLDDLDREVVALDRHAVNVRHISTAIRRELEKEKTEKESPREKRDPRGHFDLMAEELDKVYPHGFTNDGRKRPPGLKQAARVLKEKVSRGFSEAEIRGGVEGFAKAVGSRSKFSPAMFRWLENEGWREVERSKEKKLPTKQEIKDRDDAARNVRAERLSREASRAGVKLDPDTGKVIDWGPSGAPVHAGGRR